MHLTNDSPSFTPVHSQIRAIGPRVLHLWKGRGHIRQLCSCAFRTASVGGFLTPFDTYWYSIFRGALQATLLG